MRDPLENIVSVSHGRDVFLFDLSDERAVSSPTNHMLVALQDASAHDSLRPDTRHPPGRQLISLDRSNTDLSIPMYDCPLNGLVIPYHPPHDPLHIHLLGEYRFHRAVGGL